MAKKKHRERGWAPVPASADELVCDENGRALQIFDDHTHLASAVRFVQQLSAESVQKGRDPIPVIPVEEIIRRARSVGVEGLIDCACEYPELTRAVNMAKTYENVYAAVAIHPNEAVKHGHRAAAGPDGLEIEYFPWHDISIDDAMARVYEIAKNNPDEVVAIGETGLDYFRTGEEARQAQKEAFRAHIALACELNLPLQIHDRDAHEDVIDILLHDKAPERTVFHSFAAGAEMGRILRENGWYASISGTVSYKNNEDIRQGVREIGPDLITIETDAPYLPPMPWRGRPNAPYLLPLTLKAVAETLNLTVRETAEKTRENVRKIYGV